MWEKRGRVLSCLPFTRNRCIHMKAGASVVLIFNLQNHYLLRCSLLIFLLSYVSRDVLFTVSIVLCSLSGKKKGSSQELGGHQHLSGFLML